MKRPSKEDLERHYFEQFRTVYELPPGEVHYTDKPDVIVRGSDVLGIEIEQLYIASGSDPASEQMQWVSLLRFCPRKSTSALVTIASAAYNANNQLSSWNGTPYSYDANGNVLSDGALTYTWDSRNQLSALNGSASASFLYDGVGRRIGKTINSATSGFVFDGANYIQELSGTGSSATVTANLLTGGTDETFERLSGGSGSIPLTDALGSNVAEANSAQSITTNYSFEPYGNTAQNGTNTGNAQQYTGRENDGTGLYYYRARYYNPGSGRFIQEDPIGWASGQPNN